VAAHLQGITILDVRGPEEVQGPDGHISGSLNIPLPELEQRRAEIPSGKPVVVVCHSGSRSALATQQLLKEGLADIANLRGGLSRWSDEGYPLAGAVAL
jgi:rhodanese-related sulfurtransferase